MNPNVQNPPSAKEVKVLNRYTGFREPLSKDRNTTLPHPEADTSENASIDALDSDIDIARRHNRLLLLLGRYHLPVASKGFWGRTAR
ncbi:hypothetical protein M430DRAFT_34930 [Amorphotheca resinae ATCC 22711]|uniref:Uncharacterized protein n=1 Tax=Amorphotheca resinae ATCC 22711 TaxID=857342 RepID=A0A2T3B1C0_AMORE|nr:hypothetical protein M430DRAFT_34930 [Amorphotheca resinae ATCC 22711]PSS18356.1 hypothetical protein M430DRAFT_34930 [Amorphotheca resinae ATCC 22711]